MKKVALLSVTCGALVWLTAPATANETQQAQATVITAPTSTTAAPSAVPVALPAGFKFRKETEGLNPELRLRVELLLADPDNSGKVGLESAYRTPARQQQLVDCHAAHNPACPWPVDPPEESEHVKGNAVDFNGDLRLAVTLAKKWGLYQRYGDRDPVHFELDPKRTPMEG